jgi:hypothetical protein
MESRTVKLPRTSPNRLPPSAPTDIRVFHHLDTEHLNNVAVNTIYNLAEFQLPVLSTIDNVSYTPPSRSHQTAKA